MGIRSSFSLLNASPHVLLGMKCFDKFFYVIFTVKRCWLCSHGMSHYKRGMLTKASIKGHKILLMYPSCISLKKKKDGTIRWYALHLHKLRPFSKICNHSSVAFSATPCIMCLFSLMSYFQLKASMYLNACLTHRLTLLTI